MSNILNLQEIFNGQKKIYFSDNVLKNNGPQKIKGLYMCSMANSTESLKEITAQLVTRQKFTLRIF